MKSGEQGYPIVCETAEHRTALRRSSLASLDERELHPSLMLLRERLADERLWQAMLEVTRFSGVVWSGDSDLIVYRHDRVRDYLLAEAMAELASRDPHHPAYLDPFHAEVSADALVSLGAPRELVDVLSSEEPLVLAVALSAVETGSAAEARILSGLQTWWDAERSTEGGVPVRFTLRGGRDEGLTGRPETSCRCRPCRLKSDANRWLMEVVRSVSGLHPIGVNQ
jgi:hypothetical protein